MISKLRIVLILTFRQPNKVIKDVFFVFTLGVADKMVRSHRPR